MSMIGLESSSLDHPGETLTKVVSMEKKKDEEEINDNPIEEVRLTVPITDDPTLHCLTFRTWFLGLTACIFLSFINKFFAFRENMMSIDATATTILALPIGHFMARALPTRVFHLPLPFLGKKWSFSLNPGPFNIKEHVLIFILASSGGGGLYASHIVSMVKAFYHRKLNVFAALLLCHTSQVIGYAWSGIFRKYLVDSPYMWWPSTLVSVSLFRTLHEKEKRSRGGVTRLQFFIIALLCSFAYYIIPGYFFPTISTISIACYIWKNSHIAQQIGSGRHGLGIGSFTLDWNVISYLGSPLAYPAFAIINIMFGFFVILYIVQPIAYYMNLYQARRFPFISSGTYDEMGQSYNITKVLNEQEFSFDQQTYEGYSKLYLSVFFALSYGLNFATLTATMSHVLLFYGRSIWRMTIQSTKELVDVHCRISRRNYKQVPQWWFVAMLILSFGFALYACEGFNRQLQLPWWWLLIACALAFVFTLPIGIITATTNQGPGLNVISELIVGFLYPGRPLANTVFKTYSTITMSQALGLINDFKFGHYMKIPPRSMFIVQLVGTIVATQVSFMTTWWLITTVPNMCDVSALPPGSPWTCPGDHVFYSASIIWGVISPLRMFSNNGVYPQIMWFFLFGALAPIPVWLLSKKFPDKQWIKLINMPIIISGTDGMPPGRSINYTSWGMIGMLFNYFVFRRFKKWWAKYNYVLSAGLDSGLAFMGVLIFFGLQYRSDMIGPEWWGLSTDDHCPLATCPTASGIKVDSCPVL